MTIFTLSPHLVTEKRLGSILPELCFTSGKLLPKVNTVLRKVYISKIGKGQGERKVWKHDLSDHEDFNHLQFQQQFCSTNDVVVELNIPLT